MAAPIAPALSPICAATSGAMVARYFGALSGELAVGEFIDLSLFSYWTFGMSTVGTKQKHWFIRAILRRSGGIKLNN